MAKASKRTDNFPNYMSWAITQTGADVFTTDKIFTPIPRNQQVTGNRATVMELLWAEVSVPGMGIDAMNENVIYGMSTGGVPTAVLQISEGNCIFQLQIDPQISVTGGNVIAQPFRVDFQSQDGYGVLLATDAFHAYIDSTNTANAHSSYWRLYYRFVQIPVSEFIGIVQSQQTS